MLFVKNPLYYWLDTTTVDDTILKSTCNDGACFKSLFSSSEWVYQNLIISVFTEFIEANRIETKSRLWFGLVQ